MCVKMQLVIQVNILQRFFIVKWPVTSHTTWRQATAKTTSPCVTPLPVGKRPGSPHLTYLTDNLWYDPWWPREIFSHTVSHAHARSSKSFCVRDHFLVSYTICGFLRPPNTTDLSWAQMTYCVGRHICTPFESSSLNESGRVVTVSTRPLKLSPSWAI